MKTFENGTICPETLEDVRAMSTADLRKVDMVYLFGLKDQNRIQQTAAYYEIFFMFNKRCKEELPEVEALASEILCNAISLGSELDLNTLSFNDKEFWIKNTTKLLREKFEKLPHSAMMAVWDSVMKSVNEIKCDVQNWRLREFAGCYAHAVCVNGIRLALTGEGAS